jgi:hypothetical protein
MRLAGKEDIKMVLETLAHLFVGKGGSDFGRILPTSAQFGSKNCAFWEKSKFRQEYGVK